MCEIIFYIFLLFKKRTIISFYFYFILISFFGMYNSFHLSLTFLSGNFHLFCIKVILFLHLFLCFNPNSQDLHEYINLDYVSFQQSIFLLLRFVGELNLVYFGFIIFLLYFLFPLYFFAIFLKFEF